MNIPDEKIREVVRPFLMAIHSRLLLNLGTLQALLCRLGRLVVRSWLEIVKFWAGVGQQIANGLLTQWYRIALFSLFLATLLLLPGQNSYSKALLIPETTTVKRLPIVLPTPAPYPVNRGLLPPPVLTASAVTIVDVASAVPMYEKQADVALPPASTTKIMTALVVLENFPLDQNISLKKVNTDGRVMGLVPGEVISVEALLYGVLVHSANDAATTLASSFPGGTEAFVDKMNEKAEEFHLTATHFTNPAGFDDPNHRMSARDLARLSLVALNNPVFAKMVSTRSITVADSNFTRFHTLVNVNELLGRIPGVGGLKTGYTREAGENLVTLMVKPYASFITVVLGSKDRFGETEKLLSWTSQNFSWQTSFKTSSWQ